MWNRTTEMDIRRAFTAFQLMTILEENHRTSVLIEHDPLLYLFEVFRVCRLVDTRSIDRIV